MSMKYSVFPPLIPPKGGKTQTQEKHDLEACLIGRQASEGPSSV
jgi:hypothetical protein